LSREEELNRANGDETKRKREAGKVEEGEKEKKGLRSDARQRRIRK